MLGKSNKANQSIMKSDSYINMTYRNNFHIIFTLLAHKMVQGKDIQCTIFFLIVIIRKQNSRETIHFEISDNHCFRLFTLLLHMKCFC